MDMFKVFIQSQQSYIQGRYDRELQRLLAAVSHAPSGPGGRGVLALALNYSQHERMQSEAAIQETQRFYHTLSGMLGSRSAAPSCGLLACGPSAECKAAAGARGYRCYCKVGFEGDGFACKSVEVIAAALLTAQPIMGMRLSREVPPDVRDIHIAVLSPVLIAVVLRDASLGNQGYLVPGRVTETQVVWAPWQNFTAANTSAFSPVVAGLPNKEFLIAYRDQDTGGAGYLVGGHLDLTEAGIGEPILLSREQSQRMVLVPMDKNNMVCLYAGRPQNDLAAWGERNEDLQAYFGGAALVKVGLRGQLQLLGKFRFARDEPVTRIAATAMSPTSLVVAYRTLPTSDELGWPSRELAMRRIEMVDEELVVDQQPFYVEPQHAKMWFRDVAQLTQNLFAYSYYSGKENETKMTIVRVDPLSHQMTVAGGPVVLAKGSSSYVQSIPLASGNAPPKSFTYFQHPGGNGMAEVCRISSKGVPDGCRNVRWADNSWAVVSGARLQDGRLMFVAANEAGKPFFQLLTASDAQLGYDNVV
jgi:hypothetical protein